VVSGFAVIDGVRIDPLQQLHDERGAIFHMLRADDPVFEAFGEIYFSFVHPGWVKGWHLHTRMTLNYAVPVGQVRLVLYDARTQSATMGQIQEIELGAHAYQRVRVPNGVWNGFLGLGAIDSLVANCATLPHDPAEMQRMPPNDARIPYRWDAGAVRGG
jgi:dTDP-4-dehydrorhamnose 3,5-epimerase